MLVLEGLPDSLSGFLYYPRRGEPAALKKCAWFFGGMQPYLHPTLEGNPTLILSKRARFLSL